VRSLDAPGFLHRVSLNRDRIESFDEYPFNLPLVRDFDSLEFTTRITFVVGENGTGKSTLIEAIAIKWGFNAEGGSRNFEFETHRAHSELYRHLYLTRNMAQGAPRDGYFLRAESFFNVASELDRLGIRRGYGGMSMHEQSHGEAFMTLLVERFADRGLYILDEPEAALSPNRQLAALTRIHDLARSGSQFIIATHSPILMALPGARILLIDEGKLREVAYEDTEHYQVTRDFMLRRERMLRELLRED
jgi:predicted ATPase